jgi:peroxiredoxin
VYGPKGRLRSAESGRTLHSGTNGAMSCVVKLASLAQLLFVVAAAAAVHGFVRTGIDAQKRHACSALCALKPDYAARNRLAPDFELPTLRGGRFRLAEQRGKVVILNFWTKTCRPCLEEMPSLVDLGRMLSDRDDVRLVTISTDESAEDIARTLESVGISDPPFEVLIDSDAAVVTGKYGTKLFPETWYVDPDGIIRARFDGVRKWGEALPASLAESLARPATCPVEFVRGVPRGGQGYVCE